MTHIAITRTFVTSHLKARDVSAHKGDFGHALLVAGSYGKMGAAVLAARACLRSGVGLLTVHVPVKGVEIMQVAVPEAMVNADTSEKIITALPADLSRYTAVGIGPGIGQEPFTKNALLQLLLAAGPPLVLDADALNLLANHRELMELLPPGTILTPHAREFERLAARSFKTLPERLEAARAFAARYKVTLVLKGAGTAVCTPSGLTYINTTGNPGMATAGSGDVLTGLITALLAQGYAPAEAAAMGVFLHGDAGDRAAARRGEAALIASDIIECF